MAEPQVEDLSFETAHGPRVGFFARPDGEVRGAVVVVHEIFGRAPEIERVAVRLATAGFAALMPDLFAGRFHPVCIQRAMRQLARGEGEMIDVLRDAGDAVASASGVPRDRVAVIGFCLGGGLALAVGRAFCAVSTNYGDVPPVDVLRGIGPTIGCYGGRDRAFRKAPELLRARLGEVGVEPEVHVFPDAGHAFLADGHHPIASFFTRPLLDVDPKRDADDRERGWSLILDFLGRHAAA